MTPPDKDALVFLCKTPCFLQCDCASTIGKDLIAAPASQSYVERMFLVCGWFRVGCRNRLLLECCIFYAVLLLQFSSFVLWSRLFLNRFLLLFSFSRLLLSIDCINILITFSFNSRLNNYATSAVSADLCALLRPF